MHVLIGMFLIARSLLNKSMYVELFHTEVNNSNVLNVGQRIFIVMKTALRHMVFEIETTCLLTTYFSPFFKHTR